MAKKEHITPVWPKRAVVTAGMPYGNKSLHFGHVGGVFVPADVFSRFLRDRIGAENVRFVSGTDCFGSPIEEGYRKEVEAGTLDGSILDYVQRNHDRQKATLDAYDISLDLYEGSGLGNCGEIHQQVTNAFIEKLRAKGYLHLEETNQFYDAQEGMFLNGRQVQGHCPVQGCKSEKAYADECDLGHQYEPEDLINPISNVSGTVPEMRKVANWYFDLPGMADVVRDYVEGLADDPQTRPVVTKTIREFLVPPIIFVKVELHDDYLAVADKLPAHEYRDAAKGKQSFELEFKNVVDRDLARTVLTEAGIRFRTGKALVPFRISGNASWGVACPVMTDDEGNKVEGLTVWCWPESLISPISETIAANDKMGLPRSSWRDFWCSKDAGVYQFIGQDNLYFYGVAQPALWAALQKDQPIAFPAEGELQQTKLVANHHILFGDKKASSSGDVKPPTADELLEHYTAEQLRAHWLALALGQKSVGFKPKVFEADEAKRNDPRVADPALKEGALLTKVFNRLARSCLYEAAKNFDCLMPLGEVSTECVTEAKKALAAYDETMYKVELHAIMPLVETFIRYANKYWSSGIKAVEASGNAEERRQVLVDSFYLLRVATLLMHPVVPAGCEKICDYLDFDASAFFSWEYGFGGMDELCSEDERAAKSHRVKELPPRTDFFRAHESQFKKK
ncbi:MAG: class I tRNA ligase family protein [Coriobacteriia bacterium]|nr:class I tRNA ligase family protein [Coriobacteriia bacterium]